jgi:hypothetical protein
MARDELGAFDEELFADAGIERSRLEGLARDHQTLVRELPGVDDIVYEWRRYFDGALLSRTPEVYVLALPGRIWTEFTDRLELDEDAAGALRRLHDRQARRLVELAAIPEGREPMVLTRP